ncbi:MAG: helix-turn-helix domain-containing protein [Sporichthyaceae bacterium]
MQHIAAAAGHRAYSTAELADLFGVARQTVARWIATGSLVAFDIGSPGRPRLRVTEGSVAAFIAERRLG